MEILSAYDIHKGKKAKKKDKFASMTLTQPVQMIKASEKDEEWISWNMDWLEWQGLKQLEPHARRFLKNYKLGKGIMDKSDYVREEDNDYVEILDTLSSGGGEVPEAMELKFYPIVPNIINTLLGEFATRSTKITYYTTDDSSYNELKAAKYSMIEESLVSKASSKLYEQLIAQGLDPEDDEFKAQLSPDNVKSLPEIEAFFKKDYQSIPEIWANKQHAVDVERFDMRELEIQGFSDMLHTDREFWHFPMHESDYSIELWNPVTTFYNKALSTPYISDSNYVGNFDLTTASGAINKHGWKMTAEQIESLESLIPASGTQYLETGPGDSYYDPTKSKEWNVEGASLDFRKMLSRNSLMTTSDEIINYIFGESETSLRYGDNHLYLRETTVYWKTQVKIGLLTEIGDLGQVTQTVITESFKTTTNPVYNTNLNPERTTRNLVYGQHVDWTWINETWGGIKIGANPGSWFGATGDSNDSPVYVGIDGPKPGKIKFQLKGSDSLYGCKMPVEGRIFSERNTYSTSMVDILKPAQISYNLVNNQIADILVDEIGSVIALDQNALPQHSLGDDWGKGNYAKAYSAMKEFGVLPFDTTITNTENALNFQHYQTLNLEETNRLMSRIQLANYFKSQAFELIGINPQRSQGETERATAEGVRQSTEAAYSQTEMYFVNHCDHLMPKVHEMRTNIAQYYTSNNPSQRLQSITTSGEKEFFELNGTDLLLRDINVIGSTNAEHRKVLERLRQLALSNNTAGASIYDLGQIIKSDSIAEINSVMKSSEDKVNNQKKQEKEFFELNGTDLLLRDINVIGSTNAEHRKVLERLRQLALSNNTAGASIYDLGQIIKSDSIAEINSVMKSSEDKVNNQKKQEQEFQKGQQEQLLQAQAADKQADRDYESMEAEKRDRKDILIAEIRAAGLGAMMDVDQNMQSDFKDQMDEIRKTDEYNQSMDLKRQDQNIKQVQHNDKLALENKKMSMQMQMKNKDVEIAKTNKNQYDSKK